MRVHSPPSHRLTAQLNPVWDERLWFHVRRWETNHSISFQLFDYDRASANDFIGEVTLPLADLIAKAPKPDPETGVFRTENGHITGDVLIDFDLPIAVNKLNSLISSKVPTLHMCVAAPDTELRPQPRQDFAVRRPPSALLAHVLGPVRCVLSCGDDADRRRHRQLGHAQ